MISSEIFIIKNNFKLITIFISISLCHSVFAITEKEYKSGVFPVEINPKDIEKKIAFYKKADALLAKLTPEGVTYISNLGNLGSAYFELAKNDSTSKNHARFLQQARKYFIEVEKSFNSIKMSVPKDYASALRELAATWEREQATLQLLEVAKPKIEFFNAVADSKDAVPMNEVSKVLAVKGMGRNNLFEFLRNQKILMNNNIPYQKYVDLSYFRVVEQKYMKQGEECITFKTLVYQRGLDFIRKTLLKESGATT